MAFKCRAFAKKTKDEDIWRDSSRVYVRFPRKLPFKVRLWLLFGASFDLVVWFSENNDDFKKFYELTKKSAMIGFGINHWLHHYLFCKICRENRRNGVVKSHERVLAEYMERQKHLQDLKGE